MRTPLQQVKGSPTDSDAVGRTLTAAFLKGRELLPLAANNKPSMSNPFAARVAKEMSLERSKEFKRLWAVAECMVRDGVPLALVTAALRQMITMLEVESAALIAERMSTTPHVLPILLRQETRAQGRLDIAQLRVLEQPECPHTLSDVLYESSRYTATLDAFLRAVTGLLHRTQHVSPTAGLRRIAR